MRRKIALGLLALVVGLALLLWLMPGPEERLAKLITALRARGEPVTLAEMEPPMPPAAENGAPELDAALDWWEANRPEPDDEGRTWEERTAGPWNPGLAHPWEESATPEQMAALSELLRGLAPFFTRVDAAVAKPRLVWPLGPRETVAELQDPRNPIPRLQMLHKLLSARAERGASAEERLAGTAAVLGVGARTHGLTLLDELVTATCFASACQQLRRALERARIDPATARARLDEDLRCAWSGRLPSLVRAERAAGLEGVPSLIDGSYWAYAEEQFGWTEPTALERWENRLERIAGGKRRNDPETADGLIAMLAELDVFLAPELTPRDVSNLRDDARLEGNGYARVIPRVAEKFVHADALARLARLALAAYAHRETHGAWPASPTDLAPQFADGVPLDPYTGEPFLFEPGDELLTIRAQPWSDVLERFQVEEELDDNGHVWRLPPR